MPKPDRLNDQPSGTTPTIVAGARFTKGTGREFVYETLKRQIVSLRRAPGSELDEAQLVTELGVSRTPLREAFIKLSGDGLVVLMPNRGASVAPMDLSYTQEHLEAFDLMQRIATSWAATRRSDEDLVAIRNGAAAFAAAFDERDPGRMIDTNFTFHEAIGTACGNRNISRTYVKLLSENLRIARLAMTYECYGSVEAYEAHIGTIAAEHDQLVEAIVRRDAAEAERLAASHSGLARKRVLEYLSTSAVPASVGAILASAA